MNILVVSPTIPSPLAGFSTRSYYLLKALATKHAVSLLALDGAPAQGLARKTSPLENLTYSMEVIAPPESLSKRWQQLVGLLQGKPYILNASILVEMQAAIDRLLDSGRYELVLFESVLIAGYRLPREMKVIIDEHNLEYELRLRTYQHEKAWLRKWYNWLESYLLKPIEIKRCGEADAVLVTSERERLALKRQLPASVIEVVPNGVDIEFFQGQCTEQEVENQIIFTGAINYYPNTNAVLFFAQQCWPLIRAQIPTATWQIVGKNPPLKVQRLAELPGVTVTGSVPDVRPYLAAAAVAIVPIRIGSGTRLKILEAFSMQKAVVSTSIGCEGLEVEPGRHLLVADQPETFAQAVVGLLRDAEKRRELGRAGRSLVEAEYSWEYCGSRFLRVFERI
jgi:sugar transferase (PEP-CTERM/EpsH1 system associated)